MKFGIHNPSWVCDGDPFEGLKAKAQSAEGQGFAWFSAMDHLIQIPGVGAPDEPFIEGWTALSALAAVTSRIRLSTLATSVGCRNPAHLASLPVSTRSAGDASRLAPVPAISRPSTGNNGWKFPERPATPSARWKRRCG